MTPAAGTPGNERPAPPVPDGELGIRFKDAFRGHPAGIAVIAATTPEGPVGLTASSVASVSVDPPALTFSVTRATGSAGGILGAASFTVNLLGDTAADVAVATSFAVSGAERFTAEQGWATLPTGEPVLAGALRTLRCRAIVRTPVGSSVAVVAEVLEVSEARPGLPLVYVDRTFVRLGDEVTAP